MSIGVTTTLGNAFSEMIEHADQALFRAKAEGRNRVVDFSSGHQE